MCGLRLRADTHKRLRKMCIGHWVELHKREERIEAASGGVAVASHHVRGRRKKLHVEQSVEKSQRQPISDSEPTTIRYYVTRRDTCRKIGHRDEAKFYKLFGQRQFPASDIEAWVERCRDKGITLVVTRASDAAAILSGRPPSSPKAQAAAVEEIKVEAGSHVNKERGILTMPGSSRTFVVNCTTGRLIPMERARFIGVSKADNRPYWIALEASVLDNEVMYASVFNGGKPPSRFVHDLAMRLALRNTSRQPKVKIDLQEVTSGK